MNRQSSGPAMLGDHPVINRRWALKRFVIATPDRGTGSAMRSSGSPTSRGTGVRLQGPGVTLRFRPLRGHRHRLWAAFMAPSIRATRSARACTSRRTSATSPRTAATSASTRPCNIRINGRWPSSSGPYCRRSRAGYGKSPWQAQPGPPRPGGAQPGAATPRDPRHPPRHPPLSSAGGGSLLTRLDMPSCTSTGCAAAHRAARRLSDRPSPAHRRSDQPRPASTTVRAPARRPAGPAVGPPSPRQPAHADPPRASLGLA